MAAVFHGCRSGWSAEQTLAWAKLLGLKFLSTPAMVDWVSACVQARTPKSGLIFRQDGMLTRILTARLILVQSLRFVTVFQVSNMYCCDSVADSRRHGGLVPWVVTAARARSASRPSLHCLYLVDYLASGLWRPFYGGMHLGGGTG